MLGAPSGDITANVTMESSAHLEVRVAADHLKASLAMPPPIYRPPSWTVAPAGRHQQAAALAATAAPMLIPTASMMHRSHQQQQQHALAGGGARRGIQITVSRNKNVPSNDGSNTWPRNADGRAGAGGLRRSRSTSNHNSSHNFNNKHHNHHHHHHHHANTNRYGNGNDAASSSRSPVSMYGDGALHSFHACGAPGCQLCAQDGGVRQAAFFLHDRRSVRSDAPESKPGRSLIPHSCEHCRMTFIPKVGAADECDDGEASTPRSSQGAAASLDDGSTVSECGSSVGRVEGALVALEGSLAGGSAATSPASSTTTVAAGVEEDGEELQQRPLSPLVGVRTRRPSSASSSRSQESFSGGGSVNGSTGGGDSNDYNQATDGFCSGECKMSYMLTNPAALRRRRAAAQAQAAARAAYEESKLEAMRRAEARQGATAAGRRRRHEGEGDGLTAERARE